MASIIFYGCNLINNIHIIFDWAYPVLNFLFIIAYNYYGILKKKLPRKISEHSSALETWAWDSVEYEWTKLN